MLGNLGHLSVITSFVAVLAAIYAYYESLRTIDKTTQSNWIRLAHISFGLHGFSVLAAISSLFSIIYFHHYEYHYAWKHSSNELPVHFMISCFWEGQEGSFLLWIFWNVIIGFILTRTARSWEPTTMILFCMIQASLVSMLLGVHLATDLKIGSSPFLLLRDVSHDEIFRKNPDFIPRNGTGLNPLLQNIWMVIHPPVIFLGFALSAVPFVFALAALWKKQFKTFVSKMAPWLLTCVGVLGIGIMMGAYWAYETLNFGGYWNWDPVENAVFIPWLVLLAAVHGTVLYRRVEKGLSLTLFLSMAGFILILYATFLTRSGILGNASVHAFTDLGLSGQLLIVLLLFTLGSLATLIYRRKTIGRADQNTPIFSIEFWMIIGIAILALSAFQVFLPTSIPVLNAILEGMGIDKKFAPPANQVNFYSKFQLWFGFSICLACSIGQLVFRKKIRSLKTLENELTKPLIITLITAAICLPMGQTTDIGYICLITGSILLLTISVKLIIELMYATRSLSAGGLLAHAGGAIMLIGFVYSAGHKKVLSQNITINAPESNLPVHTIQENLLLSRNVPKSNNGYIFTYKGTYYRYDGGLVRTDDLLSANEPGLKIVSQTTSPREGQISKGDTIRIKEANKYYAIELNLPSEKKIIINPRVQNNPTMGYMASPSIKSNFIRDIYTHVTNFPDPEKVKWNPTVSKTISPGEVFEVDGLKLRLEEVRINENPAGILPAPNDIALEALVHITDQSNTYEAKPVFHISANREVRLFPDEIKAIGTKVLLKNLNPDQNTYQLEVTTSQRDWITIKSIEMPLISLVWLGFLLMTGGIGTATFYRLWEARPDNPKKTLRIKSGLASYWKVLTYQKHKIMNHENQQET